jgi:hypothetical protein
MHVALKPTKFAHFLVESLPRRRAWMAFFAQGICMACLCSCVCMWCVSIYKSSLVWEHAAPDHHRRLPLQGGALSSVRSRHTTMWTHLGAPPPRGARAPPLAAFSGPGDSERLPGFLWTWRSWRFSLRRSSSTLCAGIPWATWRRTSRFADRAAASAPDRDSSAFSALFRSFLVKAFLDDLGCLTAPPARTPAAAPSPM